MSEENYQPTMVQVRTQCPTCKEKKDVPVKLASYNSWMYHGMLIQEAFPELNDDDRERIMTGTCQKCWDDMWDYMEDEESNDDEEPAF